MPLNARLALTLALALSTHARVTAAQAALDIRTLGAPSFESFSVRDGLPDGVIVSIGVDGDGVTWAGSPKGLYRFVGHRWQRHAGPERGMVYHRMLLDGDRALWVSTSDWGLMERRRGSGWRARAGGEGLPREIYRASELVGPDGSRRTWIVTGIEGIHERRGERWVPVAGNGTLPRRAFLTASIMTHSLGGAPREWVGSGNAGLHYRVVGDTVWRPAEIPGLETTQIEDLRRSVDSGGEALWITSFGRGVYRIDRRGVRRWSVESGELPSNEVYSVVIGGDSAQGVTAWVASRRGLVRIHDDVAEVFDRRYGLPSDQVREVFLWRSPSGEDVLWLATENGVARAVHSRGRWQTATLMGSGAIGVFAVRVEEGPRGERLWIGSYRDGLGVYEAGRWRRFTPANGFPSHDVRMVERATDLAGRDALWIGAEPGHLVRVEEGPRFEVVKTPWPLQIGNAVLDVLARREAGRRELWFATRRAGVYRWRADGWTAFRATNAEGEWRVYSLAEQVERGGRAWLWAGTNQGVARFDGSRWELLRDVAGMDAGAYYGLTLLPDGDGRQVLWIGSPLRGLLRLDVTNPRAPVVATGDDLPRAINVTVYSAQPDSRGRIYVCTNVGVQQLTRTASGWVSRAFDREAGMVHEECNLNAQFIDRHDRFWTGTLGGVTVFDPRPTPAGAPKPLDVVEVRVDDQPVAADSVRLAPTARELRVEYALRSWQREGETRYRTQLVGYEDAPTAWTPDPTRTFTSLSPGSYRLRVEARDYAGVAAVPVEIAVEVLPAWWERRSVQALFVFAAALAAFAVFRWWAARILAQKQELERVVALRTQELNAANAQLVELSFTDTLTGLANRRRLQQRLRELTAGDTGAAPSALVLIDVDHFKDVNDRLGHPAGDEVLRTIATRLAAAAPRGALVARYGGEEFACLVPAMGTEAAMRVAERMRADVARDPMPVPGSAEPVAMTISAGVSSRVLATEADVHALLRDSDIALYRAKADGRNLVRAARAAVLAGRE